MKNSREVLKSWIESKELSDFTELISVKDLVEKINRNFNVEISRDEIVRDSLPGNDYPIFNVFDNPRGHSGKNRPHCLYAFSEDFVGLDQEESIVNGLKFLLESKDYQVKKEVNNIDLIAKKGNQLWLFEAKGKQTYDWNDLAFGQGLEQCFKPKIFENSEFERIRRSIGFGASDPKGHLRALFLKQKELFGELKTHIVLFIPGFYPTMIWANSKSKLLSSSTYNKQINSFSKLIYKQQPISTFEKYLDLLGQQFSIFNNYGTCSQDFCFHIMEFMGFWENKNFYIQDAVTKAEQKF
jgi:hypothetical protein